MDVVLQIGTALAQAVSRRSVNGPCEIRGAQSGSKTGVALSTCCGFALSVAHHQCSILICTLIVSLQRRQAVEERELSNTFILGRKRGSVC